VAIDAVLLWTLNHRLITVVLHACTDRFDELGLETKEFFVLNEVGASRYPAELADRLVIPRASVTAYVRSLVAKGFMRREIDESDLRRHRLALTQEGQTALLEARRVVGDEFERRLARLDDSDQDHLIRSLTAMLNPITDR
jgi:DNA-binding MarR family transcriptional regulator